VRTSGLESLGCSYFGGFRSSVERLPANFMRSLRLTESRYFSRRSFRSRIYLPVITAQRQRRFPGVTRAVTFAYVPVSLCLSPSFSARPPCIPPGARSCPHYNGITCPHITVAVPLRNTRFTPRSSPLACARARAQTRRVLFFSPRIRPRILSSGYPV